MLTLLTEVISNSIKHHHKSFYSNHKISNILFYSRASCLECQCSYQNLQLMCLGLYALLTIGCWTTGLPSANMHNATSHAELSHFTQTSRPHNTIDYSDIRENMTKIQLTLLILTIAMMMQQAASSCLYDRSQGVCCDQGR